MISDKGIRFLGCFHSYRREQSSFVNKKTNLSFVEIIDSFLYWLFSERFVCGYVVIPVNIGPAYVSTCHRVVHRWITRQKHGTYSSDKTMVLCHSTHCPTIAIDWRWCEIIWPIRRALLVSAMPNTPAGFCLVDAINCFRFIAPKREDDWADSHSNQCALHYSEYTDGWQCI